MEMTVNEMNRAVRSRILERLEKARELDRSGRSAEAREAEDEARAMVRTMILMMETMHYRNEDWLALRKWCDDVRITGKQVRR